MNLLTELFLAWRYIKPQRNAVSIITCISLMGVLLGVAVLIVVVGVMTGVTAKMEEGLLSTVSHIQVKDRYPYVRNIDSVTHKITENGGTPVPLIVRECIIQTKDFIEYKSIIGIGEDSLNGHFKLKENMAEGSTFSLDKNEIIISSALAEELNLAVKDKLVIHSPSKLSKMIETNKEGSVSFNSNRVILPEEFIVSGIYEFNIQSFDKHHVFVNIDDAADLYDEIPWGEANVIYTWTDDAMNIEALQFALIKEFPGLNITSWKQLHGQILNILSMQKSLMLFILVFIVLVAAFSIPITLTTTVIQKRVEIGLMKALGAGSGTIMRIFTIQGFIVGMVGTLLGISAGLIILHYRNQLENFVSGIAGRDLWNPNFYYFKDIPAKIEQFDIISIAVIAIILCTIGSIIPAWRAAKLEAASSLRS